MKKKRRRVFHLTWSKEHEAWPWKLKESGVSNASSFSRKKDAVAHGRRACRGIQADGGLAQLVIHLKNGRIQTEHTYGADPRRHKG